MDELFQRGDRVYINAYARQRRLSHIRKNRVGTVIAVSGRVHVVWDGDPAAEIYKYDPDLLGHKIGHGSDTGVSKDKQNQSLKPGK